MSSSAGFGGGGPDATSTRFGTPGTCCNASASETDPSSTDVKPTSLRTPKKSCSRGRRRSQSSATTRRPACASEMARLLSVVVLPSADAALVICVRRTDRSSPMNWSDVRSVR